MFFWSLFVLSLIAYYGWRWKRAGPSTALGETLLWSLLVPTWVSVSVGGLPLDVRTTIACVGLVGYCLHRKARFRTRLCTADVAASALFVVHLASDTVNDGFSIGIVFRAYGEWIIPYLAGRASVAEYDDVRRLRRVACVVALILAGWGAIESIGGANPIHSVVGARPTDRMALKSDRWGLKRAEGPTTHPIWFGMLQAMLLPWAFSAANAAFRGGKRRWAAAVPAVFAGIFFSLSRGPWLLAALTSAAFLYGLAPRARKWPAAVVLAAIVVVAVLREPALRLAQQLTDPTGGGRTVVVDGEKVRFDATTYRLILWDVYRDAMRRAGLLGFGTDRTSTFPVRVPMGQLDPETMRKVESIDCEYILIDLRFGLLGAAALTALVAGAGVSSYWRGRRAGDGSRIFLLACGALLSSVPAVWLVEWMPSDYGFVLLWSCGVVSGFGSYHRAHVGNSNGAALAET